MQKVIFKTERELLSFFRCHKGKTIYERERKQGSHASWKNSLNRGGKRQRKNKTKRKRKRSKKKKTRRRY